MLIQIRTPLLLVFDNHHVMLEKRPKEAPVMSFLTFSPFNITVERDFVSLMNVFNFQRNMVKC